MIDILVVLAVALLVSLCIYKIIKDKKKGKTSCGHNCAHCSGCYSEISKKEVVGK